MENENPDGVNEENTASKKRNRSQSSSSDSSDSSSGSSRCPRRSKSRKVDQTVSYAHFEFLSQQVAFLTNMISKNNDVSNSSKEHVQIAVDSNDLNLRRPTVSVSQINQLNLSDPSTIVKDPLYARANENYVKKLIELQRFKCDDWYAVRFTDAQKKYLATPGFVELNVNDSLKRFEAATLRDDPRSYLLERSFAGLTNALLSQKEELHKTLQTLVDWANESKQTLTPNTLFDKIEYLFSKESSYSKVTDDLLQIVCGRRADCITSRRDTLLRQIPEEFHRDVLYKIPPSEETLFDDNLVQNYLQKIGGADKLVTTLQPMPRSQTKDNFYQNQKPSTSKQIDNTFFRRTYSSKKHAPRPSKKKIPENPGNRKQKEKKSRPNSSFKNKRRE